MTANNGQICLANTINTKSNGCYLAHSFMANFVKIIYFDQG